MFALAWAPPLSTAFADEQGGKVYEARGEIKSFGKGRGTVRIAHEEIPNFMGAMTMEFVPKSPKQMEGFAVGDRVRFTFRVSDGKFLIETMAKEKPRKKDP